MPYAYNKGADQPAHPRNLISTFVVRCLDSIMPLVSIAEVSRLELVAVAEQTGLSHTWSKLFEDTFSRDAAHMYCIICFVYLIYWLTSQSQMSPVKRICVFEHSVMTKFNCACPATQRGQGSGFLSEGSS